MERKINYLQLFIPTYISLHVFQKNLKSETSEAFSTNDEILNPKKEWCVILPPSTLLLL